MAKTTEKPLTEFVFEKALASPKLECDECAEREDGNQGHILADGGFHLAVFSSAWGGFVLVTGTGE